MTTGGAATLRIGLVQARDLGDPEKNLEHHEQLIRSAAKKGAKVVCLQELFRTRYFCATEDPANFDLAEKVPGPTTERFSKLARELGAVLIVPLFEKRAPGVYHNTAAVLDADGTLVGTYRKMHIPHDPNFFEKYYFAPGDLGFRTFDVHVPSGSASGSASASSAPGRAPGMFDDAPSASPGAGAGASAGPRTTVRLGVLICWDQWFPEGARATVLQGAQVLFYPTAIGNSDEDALVSGRQRESWMLAQRAHALANGVYVAAVNRSGREGGLTFWGGSFVADTSGHVIAEAGKGEEVLIADLDLAATERTRRAWPFLRDRRTDAYGDLLKRFADDA